MKKLTRLTIATALAIAASTAGAAEFLDRAETGPAVLSGFVSWHNTSKFEAPPDGYNQNNIGIGYRNVDGWAAGYYRNSFRHDSLYIAREWQWHVTENLRAGVIAGLATGYRSMKILPVVMPELVYKLGSSEIAVMAAPGVNEDSPGLVSLQYRLNLN